MKQRSILDGLHLRFGRFCGKFFSACELWLFSPNLWFKAEETNSFTRMWTFQTVWDCQRSSVFYREGSSLEWALDPLPSGNSSFIFLCLPLWESSTHTRALYFRIIAPDTHLPLCLRASKFWRFLTHCTSLPPKCSFLVFISWYSHLLSHTEWDWTVCNKYGTAEMMVCDFWEYKRYCAFIFLN